MIWKNNKIQFVWKTLINDKSDKQYCELLRPLETIYDFTFPKWYQSTSISCSKLVQGFPKRFADFSEKFPKELLEEKKNKSINFWKINDKYNEGTPLNQGSLLDGIHGRVCRGTSGETPG